MQEAMESMTDEQFSALGKAWYQENLRRHQIPDEEMMQGIATMHFFKECECAKQCECIELCNNCCECVRCNADEDCKICKGEMFFYPLRAVDKASKEEQDKVWKELDLQKQSNFKEYYMEEYSEEYSIPEEALAFFKTTFLNHSFHTGILLFFILVCGNAQNSLSCYR